MESRINFPQLTGVRAIAAYFVFFHHFNPLKNQENFSFLSRMIDELHVGVTLFFVLSGFLIYYRYGGQPKEQFKFGKYLKFRFARIYPVYFLILALTFTFEEYPSPHLYWLNLTLLKGWSDAYKFTGIAQSWSLTVEETFYFLAPVIFFVLDRKKMGMAWIFAGAAICVLVMSETHQHFANWFGDWNFIFLYSFPGRICEFLLGILGAKYLLKSRESSPSCSFPFKTGLFSFAILASIASLALLKTEGLKFGVQDPWGILINNLILPLFYAGLLVSLVSERSMLSRLLSLRFVGLLGSSSYVFYLIHAGVMSEWLTKIEFSLFSKFIVLNLISIGIYWFYERHLNRLIRNF